MKMEHDGCCYLCNECPNSYTTLSALERHMAKHHADLSQTESMDESEIAADNEINGFIKMTVHEEHKNGDVSKSSPTSSELSCESATDKANHILDDSVTMNGSKNVTCRFCPKCFEDRHQLNIHYKQAHRDKPQYECDECHTIFAVKRELSTHMRIHSGEQPHKCTQCAKEFGTRQLLKKHWMWHTGERSHVCPHCGKAFFQKGHLTQHLMIHAGGRPHQCHLCQKTFIFKFDLNRHMKIHAERGYSCDKCGRSFLKQMQLDEHQLKCKISPSNRVGTSARSITPTEPKTETKVTHKQTPTPSLMPSSFSSDEVAKMAQVVAAQQQQQQRALVAAVAQQNLQMNPLVLQSLAPSNTMNGSNSQPIICIFCLKYFTSQTSYAIHLNSAHLQNIFEPNSFTQFNDSTDKETYADAPLSTSVKSSKSDGTKKRYESELSPCNLSMPKISPSISLVPTDSPHQSDIGRQSEQSDSDKLSARSTPPKKVLRKVCLKCDNNRRRIAELEKNLQAKHHELMTTKDLMRRISTIAGSLLQSCNEFDRQWGSQNQRVYSQIQSVLYNME